MNHQHVNHANFFSVHVSSLPSPVCQYCLLEYLKKVSTGYYHVDCASYITHLYVPKTLVRVKSGLVKLHGYDQEGLDVYSFVAGSLLLNLAG